MPKSLAQGRVKVAILTTAPANPAAPTVAELNAGINAAAAILLSDFTLTATDSDKVNEPSLADANNVNAFGAGNYNVGFTIFRFFNGSNLGQADSTADVLFTAAKTKGTSLWIYPRKTGKLETAAWAASDEIYLGAEFLTDTPQDQSGGFIKFRVPGEVQKAYPFISAAA
jgi:hypothetical protein